MLQVFDSMGDNMSEHEIRNQVPNGINRRNVVKGAAWSVPVVAAAIASPPASASLSDLGTFSLDGVCGVMESGTVETGFDLNFTWERGLDGGTTIDVVGTGLTDIGVFTVTGLDATVTSISPTESRITFTGPTQYGTKPMFRTLINVRPEWTLTGTVTVYRAHTGGSKLTGTVVGTSDFCAGS